jgi:ribosomal protein S21
MIEVTRKDSKESTENLVRRFNRRVQQSGLVIAVKQGQYFEKVYQQARPPRQGYYPHTAQSAESCARSSSARNKLPCHPKNSSYRLEFLLWVLRRLIRPQTQNSHLGSDL